MLAWFFIRHMAPFFLKFVKTLLSIQSFAFIIRESKSILIKFYRSLLAWLLNLHAICVCLKFLLATGRCKKVVDVHVGGHFVYFLLKMKREPLLVRSSSEYYMPDEEYIKHATNTTIMFKEFSKPGYIVYISFALFFLEKLWFIVAV